MTPKELNILGLIIDILGVVLLFFYEPPKKEIGTLLLESAPSEKERKRIRKIKRCISNFALFLLIIGFCLQIYSNII